MLFCKLHLDSFYISKVIKEWFTVAKPPKYTQYVYKSWPCFHLEHQEYR